MRTGLLLALMIHSAVKARADATHVTFSSPLQSAIFKVAGNSLPGKQQEVRHDHGH
jgi:hypothetical protein